MPDSKRYLHPDAIRKIARLEVRARYIVEGFLSGMHRSPYFGQSVEFLQHREYVAGDDLRHVDWKVWARQDRLVVKQFEEETNLRCTILVDSSSSMAYAGEGVSKFDYAATLAACLSYLVLHQQDAVGCITFDSKVRSSVPLRNKTTQLLSIVEQLNQRQPEEKTDMLHILRGVAEGIPRRGLVVLISDLLVDRPGLIKGLKLLRERGHDVMVMHVLADDELDFTFSGPLRFEGLESDDALNCNPRALREGYLQALQTYLDEVRHGCARNAVGYALFRTGQSLDGALAAFLSHRMGMQRR